MKNLTLSLTLFLGLSILLDKKMDAQNIVVDLGQPSSTDDYSYEFKFLEPKSNENFLLPEDTTGALFLNLKQYAAFEGDKRMTLMFLPEEDGQIVYVDRNNDEDLTNDGEPLFFPYEENELQFQLNPKDGSELAPTFTLQKNPEWAIENPEFADKFVDEQGRLKDQHFKVWKLINPKILRERNYFFHSGNLPLRRGTINLDGKIVDIGMFDWDNNARFSTSNSGDPLSADKLLVDINGDGMLSYLDDDEIFLLDEVFSISGKNYKFGGIDGQGQKMTLIPMDEPVNRLYRNALDYAKQERMDQEEK